MNIKKHPTLHAGCKVIEEGFIQAETYQAVFTQ